MNQFSLRPGENDKTKTITEILYKHDTKQAPLTLHEHLIKLGPFTNEDIRKKDYTNCIFFIGAQCSTINLAELNFEGSTIYRRHSGGGPISPYEATLTNGRFVNTKFAFKHYRYLKASSADFTNATFCRGRDFSNANFENANLQGAKLVAGRWSQRGLILSGANFENANLRGAWLLHADLTNVNFCGADLREAYLAGYSWKIGAPKLDKNTKIVAETPQAQEEWLKKFERIYKAIEVGSSRVHHRHSSILNRYVSSGLKKQGLASSDSTTHKLFVIKAWASHRHTIAASAYKLANQTQEATLNQIYLEAFKRSSPGASACVNGQTFWRTKSLKKSLEKVDLSQLSETSVNNGSRLWKIKQSLKSSDEKTELALKS